ncbi:MAG: ribose-phosphate pyrophosphokinase [Clostridiales bacterium]|nr:ribose-phosphate pyrophosphokinase [Clostridiales bacterium]
MDNIKIFSCHESADTFTEEVCKYLKLEKGKINSIKFKNDNNFVQIMETVRNQDVYLIQTVEPPINERIMELLIIIDAVKRASAKAINVVVPYYPYSRSDKKDQPRIPVTAKLIAQLLEAAGANRVITCDLHNPAIQSYFNIHCDKLTAERILENYFEEKKIDDMVVVATDAGSSKKAYKYSEYFKCPMALIDKRRNGNDDNAFAVNIIGEIKNKNVIIFDDEISTGGTIIEAVNIVKKCGAKDIYVGCTHGILCGNAIEKLNNSDIKEIVITNTVPLTNEKKIDKITVLNIAPIFAEVIKRNNELESFEELFSNID